MNQWLRRLWTGKWVLSHFVALFLALVVVSIGMTVGIFLWVTRDVGTRRIPLWEFPSRAVQSSWKDARGRAVHMINMDRPQFIRDDFAPAWSNARVGMPARVRFATVQAEEVDRSLVAYFPDMFYDGVVYGISAANPRGEAEEEEANEALNQELLEHLTRMTPTPAVILPRSSHSSQDGWHEDGFAVFFNRASSAAELQMVTASRLFAQPAVLKWWPHTWGADRRQHSTILQSIIPSATGLGGVASQERVLLIAEDAASRPEVQVRSSDGWHAPDGLLYVERRGPLKPRPVTLGEGGDGKDTE